MKHEFGFNIFLFAKIASAVTYTTDVFFGVLADVTKIKDFWDAKTLFLLRRGLPHNLFRYAQNVGEKQATFATYVA